MQKLMKEVPVAAKRTEAQLGLDRISVSLVPKASEELEALQARTGLSKTDIVNRAISLYALIAEEESRGQEILLRDQSTGEKQRLRFL